MATTLIDDRKDYGACWAEADLAAITGVTGYRRRNGERRVRVFAGLAVTRCDSDTEVDDPHMVSAHTDLTIEEAERLATAIRRVIDELAGIDALRTTEGE